MLTHLHLVVYTWWCWHICKEEVVGVELDQLGEERERFSGVLRTIGWLLIWNSVLGRVESGHRRKGSPISCVEARW